MPIAEATILDNEFLFREIDARYNEGARRGGLGPGRELSGGSARSSFAGARGGTESPQSEIVPLDDVGGRRSRTSGVGTDAVEEEDL